MRKKESWCRCEITFCCSFIKRDIFCGSMATSSRRSRRSKRSKKRGGSSRKSESTCARTKHELEKCKKELKQLEKKTSSARSSRQKKSRRKMKKKTPSQVSKTVLALYRADVMVSSGSSEDQVTRGIKNPALRSCVRKLEKSESDVLKLTSRTARYAGKIASLEKKLCRERKNVSEYKKQAIECTRRCPGAS